MNIALKEWDVQTRALEQGKTALLFRKGGIIEQRGEFGLEHGRFWLYPTFLHQNTGELRTDFHDLLRENPSAGMVKLQSYAMVDKVAKLEDLAQIRALEPFNALTADALERKFHYRNKPYVHALLLRVYTCQPVSIRETPEYAGCVSWVNLVQDVAALEPKPVLPEGDFLALKAQLEGML